MRKLIQVWVARTSFAVIAGVRRHLTDTLEIFERLATMIEPDRLRKELAELLAQGAFTERGFLLPPEIVHAQWGHLSFR